LQQTMALSQGQDAQDYSKRITMSIPTSLL